MRRALVLAPLLALSACGTTMGVNSDAPSGLGRIVPVAPETVTETATGPAATDPARQNVFGVSCKNSILDPSPSRESAIALMKQQAAARGFNAVHSVTVESKGAGALAMNCWAALTARGVAYRLEARPEG